MAAHATTQIGPRMVQQPGNTPHDSTADELDHERKGAEIASISPEGLPAHPRLKPRHTAALILLPIGLVGIAAVIMAIWQGVLAGLATLAIGLALGTMANPTVWAAISRAVELEEHRDGPV